MEERIAELEKQVAELTTDSPVNVPLRIGENREIVQLLILAEVPNSKPSSIFRILD